MLTISTDSSFNQGKTNEYILSIQVSLDGFSFLIYHPEENRIVCHSKHSVKISSEILLTRHFKDWIYSDEIFQKNFRKICVVVFSEQFTVLPEAFTQSEIRENAPLILFEKKEEPEIAENYIEKLKARLLFELPQGLNELIQNFFGQTEILHPLKVALSHFGHTENSLDIFAESNGFYCVLTRNSQVELVNFFAISYANDAVYYLFNLLKQFDLNPKSTSIRLAETGLNTSVSGELLKNHFAGFEKINCNPEIANPEFAGKSFLKYLF